jgi:hypothetical protein
MFESLKLVGITPAVIQLFAFAGIGGFLLFTFWRFFLVGAIALFLVFSVAASAKKDNIEIETYIQNGSITKDGVKLLPAPKEYIEDCKIHMKMSEEMCRIAWTQ